MPVTVPIAGLLASLGIYGVVIAAVALRDPDKLDEHHSNLQHPIEWIAVICIALFGMIGTAVTLAVSGGYALPYLISTAVVGLLGVAFFKYLEISPTPIFAFLINTRFFARNRRRRRRSVIRGLKKMWVESSIDGDTLGHQAEANHRLKSRNAFSGAVVIATLIVAGNTYWAVRLVDALELSFLALAPLAILWVALVFVLARAGRSLADRAKDIDWRQPF
jgi:hypothetical protein